MKHISGVLISCVSDLLIAMYYAFQIYFPVHEVHIFGARHFVICWQRSPVYRQGASDVHSKQCVSRIGYILIHFVFSPYLRLSLIHISEPTRLV